MIDIEDRYIAKCNELRLMTMDRDHWKANHDNQVMKAKVLIDRTDLPLERVKAYKQIDELQNEVNSLKAKLKIYEATN